MPNECGSRMMRTQHELISLIHEQKRFYFAEGRCYYFKLIQIQISANTLVQMHFWLLDFIEVRLKCVFLYQEKGEIISKCNLLSHKGSLQKLVLLLNQILSLWWQHGMIMDAGMCTAVNMLQEAKLVKDWTITDKSRSAGTGIAQLLRRNIVLQCRTFFTWY